jgi:hypothetical protein
VEFLFDIDQSNVHRNIRHMEPLVKKPRGKRLGKGDKRHNRSLSKEHVIGQIKKFKILGGTFRNRLTRHDMSSIISGLVNFRVMCRVGLGWLSLRR